MFRGNFSYYKFHTYAQIVLVCAGVIGNALTIIVTSRGTFQKTSTSVLLKSLALADSLVLLGTLEAVLETPFMLNTDILTKSDLTCKLHFYFVTWFSFVSTWCIAIITLERYTAVSKPYLMKIWFSRSRITIIAVLIFFIGGGLMAPRILAQKLVWFPVGENQTAKACISPNTDLSNNIKLCIIVVQSVLPIFIVCITNILIIRALHKAIKRRNEMQATGNARGMSSHDHHNQRITVMLLFVSIFFLLTMTPLAVYLIAHNKWFKINPKFAFSNANPVWKTITLCVSLNHSCNFILYVLTGSVFRTQLKQIFCKSNGE